MGAEQQSEYGGQEMKFLGKRMIDEPIIIVYIWYKLMNE
ncbi:UNVERIFIED_CONTAM: hypothetical protein ABID98_003448 [Brevibacillus sp. OAP136]